MSTSRRGSIGTFVDRILHLFQEIVNIEQVILGPQIRQIRHWKSVMVGHGRSGRMAVVTNSNHWCRGVVHQRTARDRDTMQSHEALANLRV